MVLKPYQALGCDVIGLRDIRRDARSDFLAAGYAAYCSGDTSGAKEKPGHRGDKDRYQGADLRGDGIKNALLLSASAIASRRCDYSRAQRKNSTALLL